MNKLNSTWVIRLCVSVLFASTAQASYANIVVGATRLIYPENEKEITVKLSNNGSGPVLAQSWIDKGDVNEAPEKINVPFVIVPPINRVDAGKSQTLRITYTGSPALPTTQETAYWLNILEIPPVAKKLPSNRLQVAFRTRIKIFYRPEAIGKSEKASDAAENLSWEQSKNGVVAKNSTPFYVSLASVSDGSGHSLEGKMVPPFGAVTFEKNHGVSFSSGKKVTYEYINDWGAVKSVTTAKK